MIVKLDNTNDKTAEMIVKLQRTSYQVEAELIGFGKLPPLLEAASDIIDSDEVFYGYFLDSELAGIVSYKLLGSTLDIYRLAVHPDYFKRGIAKQLLAAVEATDGIKDIIVCTGLKNTPAVRLYERSGFTETGKKEVAKDIYIVCFRKER